MPSTSIFYRNLRNGRFEEVTEKAAWHPRECSSARLRLRRLPERRDDRHRRELHQRAAAVTEVYLDSEAKLDQDQAGGDQVQSIWDWKPREREGDEPAGRG